MYTYQEWSWITFPLKGHARPGEKKTIKSYKKMKSVTSLFQNRHNFFQYCQIFTVKTDTNIVLMALNNVAGKNIADTGDGKSSHHLRTQG